MGFYPLIQVTLSAKMESINDIATKHLFRTSLAGTREVEWVAVLHVLLIRNPFQEKLITTEMMYTVKGILLFTEELTRAKTLQ